MKIKWLEYFVAVAEEGNFGRAAERLGIAQPPLSRQIMQIEEEFDVLLFNRGRNQIRLTQAGAKFLERGREILTLLEEAQLEARRTLGLFPMNNALLRSSLIRREIDVAIARPSLVDAEINSRQLLEESLVLAVPDAHRLARKGTVALRDLAGETVILYPEKPRPSFADHVLGVIRDNGCEPRSRVFTMDVQTAISLVSIEVGSAIVPASVGNAQRQGVRFVSLSNPEAKTALSVNTRIDNQSVHVKQFVDIALRVSRRIV